MSTEPVHLNEQSLTSGMLAAGLEPDGDVRNGLVELMVDAGLHDIEYVMLRGREEEDTKTLADAEKVIERAEISYAGVVQGPEGYSFFKRTIFDTLTVRMKARECSVWTGPDAPNSVMMGLDYLETWLPTAKEDGYRIRATIEGAFGAPDEEPPSQDAIEEWIEALLRMQCSQVLLTDACGMAVPATVGPLVDELVDSFGRNRLAFHFSDALGRGLANFQAAWEAGARRFATALGGLGAGAQGVPWGFPMATEDLVAYCRDQGLETNVDLDLLLKAGRFLADRLGVASRSRYAAFRSRACG